MIEKIVGAFLIIGSILYFVNIFLSPYDCSRRIEAQKAGYSDWKNIDCE